MADLSNVVRMLIHQLDATRSYLLPGYCDEDEKARAVIAFAESALAAEPPAPADLSDFQTLQGIALDMVESLRPIVLPEILGVLRRAIEQPPAPAPAADGEREELAQWLDHKGRGAWPCPGGFSAKAGAEGYEMFSGLTRAAALLREARPQPVPVADRPWERPEWCDAEGRCWWGRGADDFFSPEWIMATLASIEEFCSEAMPQHCLPHWAIAIPQPPQGGEVKA